MQVAWRAWSSIACASLSAPRADAAAWLRARSAVQVSRVGSYGRVQSFRAGKRWQDGLGRARVLSVVVCGVKVGEGDAASSVDERGAVAVESEEGGGEGEGEGGAWWSRDLKARLYLVLVPFLWGTYGPALRFIYSQPHAPSASIITLSRKGMRCQLRTQRYSLSMILK
jgi:hypothetical protein